MFTEDLSCAMVQTPAHSGNLGSLPLTLYLPCSLTLWCLGFLLTITATHLLQINPDGQNIVIDTYSCSLTSSLAKMIYPVEAICVYAGVGGSPSLMRFMINKIITTSKEQSGVIAISIECFDKRLRKEATVLDFRFVGS